MLKQREESVGFAGRDPMRRPADDTGAGVDPPEFVEQLHRQRVKEERRIPVDSPVVHLPRLETRIQPQEGVGVARSPLVAQMSEDPSGPIFA